MRKSIKTKWIKALRSGQYKQGQGALYRNGRYCCLGVLCRVMETRIKKDSGMLSDAALEKAQLTDGQHNRLSDLNDGYSTSSGKAMSSKAFDKIADWIEAHL